ncbi:MAG: LysE family translocator [Candidatus Rokuibacteriota bacterium]|jgi:threonine/homoserine/homoserine lactone efflux protein
MDIGELSAASLLTFATTTTLMNVSPGPAVMQVVGHSMSNGWRPAQASILGIFAANALYCALSVLGLGALILAAPSLFEVLKWCGVFYLAWLGVKALRAAVRPGAPLPAPALHARPRALFRQSFVLQGANPKSVLYFCTLLPVFAGDAEGAPLRIAVLGLVATVMEYPVLLGYSLLAASASRWFRGSAGRRVLDGLSGSALLAAAGTVAGNTLRHR